MNNKFKIMDKINCEILLISKTNEDYIELDAFCSVIRTNY